MTQNTKIDEKVLPVQINDALKNRLHSIGCTICIRFFISVLLIE